MKTLKVTARVFNRLNLECKEITRTYQFRTVKEAKNYATKQFNISDNWSRYCKPAVHVALHNIGSITYIASVE